MDRTVADLEAVGAAVLSWITDQVSSRAPVGTCLIDSATVGDYPAISHQDLEQLLVPGYLAELPVLDGWGFPYQFGLEAGLLGGTRGLFFMRSPGQDGSYEGMTYSGGYTSATHEDLVWADGYYVRVPPPTAGSEQEITVAQLQTSGTAMAGWFVDQVAGGRGADIDVGVVPVIDYAVLKSLLVPLYTACLPQLDGWGQALEYRLETVNLLATSVLAVRSLGADSSFEGTRYRPSGFPPHQAFRDLVWLDGLFVRRPDPEMVFLDELESGDLSLWSDQLPRSRRWARISR